MEDYAAAWEGDQPAFGGSGNVNYSSYYAIYGDLSDLGTSLTDIGTYVAADPATTELGAVLVAAGLTGSYFGSDDQHYRKVQPALHRPDVRDVARPAFIRHSDCEPPVKNVLCYGQMVPRVSCYHVSPLLTGLNTSDAHQARNAVKAAANALSDELDINTRAAIRFMACLVSVLDKLQ